MFIWKCNYYCQECKSSQSKQQFVFWWCYCLTSVLNLRSCLCYSSTPPLYLQVIRPPYLLRNWGELNIYMVVVPTIFGHLRKGGVWWDSPLERKPYTCRLYDIPVCVPYSAFLLCILYSRLRSVFHISVYVVPFFVFTFQFTLAIPIFFLLFCVFLLIVPLYAEPESTGMGLLIVCTGIPVYWFGVLWKRKPIAFQRFIGEF